MRLRVRRGDVGGVDAAALREEIEAALLEAAPELDAIDLQIVDGEGERSARAAVAPAGVTTC